jgi:YD repeat-containing protein
VENLNRPLAYGIFLQKIFASLQRDPFGVAGSIRATFGPQIRIPTEGLVAAVRADGGFSYLAAHDDDGDGVEEPSVFKITGALKILQVDAQSSELKISGGKVSIDSKNSAFKVGDYGFESELKGWVSSGAFNLEGKGNISIPGPDSGGEAVVSNVGAAACKRGFGPDVGWGYTWGHKLPKLFGWGCHLGSWRGEEASGSSLPLAGASASRARAQAGTVRQIVVAPHTRRLALRVRGTSGPPPVTFVAPDGTRYAPSGQPESAIVTDTVLATQDPVTGATYLAVDRPAPGRWRVEIPPTSGAIRVSRGQALPPLKLHMRVTGRGPRRVLHYRADRLAGRHVTFVEAGGASRRVIGEAKQASGGLRFRPAFGPQAKRTIVALPSLGGVPAPAAVVAHYHAGAIRPAKPHKLRVARRPGFRRVITWRGPHALSYLVTVKTSDGRKLRYRRDGSHRRVAVDTVPDGAKVRVAVKAISRDGVASAAAHALGR